MKDEEIIEKLKSREIKPQLLEDIVDEERAVQLRLDFLEKTTKTKLTALATHKIPAQECKPNIEMMVGAIQVPLGYIGPLVIAGGYAKGEFFVPMATTEGALVASANRGCSIIRKCGHATVKTIRSGQTRSILFRSSTVSKLLEVTQWAEANLETLKKIGEEDSQYLKLMQIDLHLMGNNLWLRLQAFTGDAMGMNMITFAGEKIGKFLQQKFSGLEFISASGNICSDKKASNLNLVKGRGKYVIAEIRIPNEKIQKYLKTSAKKIFELNYRKNWLGGMMSGSLGYNAHFANIIAAVYLATGQDLGHVVEGSQGFTTMDLIENDLYIAVTLPCIQVGTVGGGTHLPTQRACLEMLGIFGPGNPPGQNGLILGEIAAASVLAGELSLLGALAAHNLGNAHRALNR